VALKPKHQSFAATVILIISVATGLTYAVYHLQSLDHDENNGAAPLFLQVSVPTAQEMNIMGQLKPKFRNLTVPRESISGPVALEIFGYREPMFKSNETGDAADESPRPLTYTLTFTFSAGSRRFCIVNGDFYPQGARLPDGAHIERIEAHKVLIRKKERQIWIPLEVPANMVKDRTKSPQLSKQSDMGGQKNE
jgi:hypothetical protein